MAHLKVLEKTRIITLIMMYDWIDDQQEPSLSHKKHVLENCKKNYISC